ncbi:hypothetical protein [Paenibacillus polymyxa]|uniref:hypothetical protein n=1 Tax=Paenibacillus polymyxa TaxID=1406 RepID=UPI002AB3FE28|nr:hypothetical protein [Paenibacillus polymyxa]MDY8021217.1 hypothetical protein [Paenibacillus polymyxa]
MKTSVCVEISNYGILPVFESKFIRNSDDYLCVAHEVITGNPYELYETGQGFIKSIVYAVKV